MLFIQFFPESVKNTITIPMYVRVNTLMLKFKDAVKGFKSEGWTLVQHADKNNYKEFLSKVSNLGEKDFMRDMHIRNLLIFHPKAQFHQHMYPSGCLVLQDKASCLPVQILNPPPNSVVLDMCAAPGEKTSQIAALMNGKGIIYAVDSDSKQMQMLLDLMRSYRVSCLGAMNTDVLTVTNLDCPDVEYILIDPSCSESGILDRLNYNSQLDETGRIKELTNFQIKILKHAFRSFPHTKRIVYSTRSLRPEENEAVVEEVLRYSRNYKLVSASDLLKAAWLNFGSEEYQNIGKHCLYARPETDLTIGVFVAVFEHLKYGEENQFFNNDHFAVQDCGVENHSLRPNNGNTNLEENKDYNEKSDGEENNINKNENFRKKSQKQLSNVSKNYYYVLGKNNKENRQRKLAFENDQEIGGDEKNKLSTTSKKFQKTLERRKSTTQSSKIHESYEEFVREIVLGNIEERKKENSENKLKTKYLKENRKNMDSKKFENLTAVNIKTEDEKSKNSTAFSSEETENNEYVKNNVSSSSSLIQNMESKIIAEKSDNENKAAKETGGKKQKGSAAFSQDTSEKIPENENENFKKEKKSRGDHSISEDKINQGFENMVYRERNEKTEKECIGDETVEVFIKMRKCKRKNEQGDIGNEITTYIEVEDFTTGKKVKTIERQSISHESNTDISKKDQKRNLGEAVQKLIDSIYEEGGNDNNKEERNASLKEITLGRTSRHKRNCNPKKETNWEEEIVTFSSVQKSKKRRHTLSQKNNNGDVVNPAEYTDAANKEIEDFTVTKKIKKKERHTFSWHDYNKETDLLKLLGTVNDEDHNEDSSASVKKKIRNVNNNEEIDAVKGYKEKVIHDYETGTSVDKKTKKKGKHRSSQECYNDIMDTVDSVEIGTKRNHIAEVNDFAIRKKINRKERHIPSSLQDDKEGSVNRKRDWYKKTVFDFSQDS